jgi:hypothetical protein
MAGRITNSDSVRRLIRLRKILNQLKSQVHDADAGVVDGDDDIGGLSRKLDRISDGVYWTTPALKKACRARHTHYENAEKSGVERPVGKGKSLREQIKMIERKIWFCKWQLEQWRIAAELNAAYSQELRNATWELLQTNPAAAQIAAEEERMSWKALNDRVFANYVP